MCLTEIISNLSVCQLFSYTFHWTKINSLSWPFPTKSSFRLLFFKQFRVSYIHNIIDCLHDLCDLSSIGFDFVLRHATNIIKSNLALHMKKITYAKIHDCGLEKVLSASSSLCWVLLVLFLWWDLMNTCDLLKSL